MTLNRKSFVVLVSLGLGMAAGAVQAANAKKDEQNDGYVVISNGGSTVYANSNGTNLSRGEIRYDDGIRSFDGTVTFGNSWAPGHSFVQIIENRIIAGEKKGYPLLLINTNDKGIVRNIGNVGNNDCKNQVFQGTGYPVSARISSKNGISISVNGCTFSAGKYPNAYIKFGSYKNKNGRNTMEVNWTNVSPAVSPRN
jgi:hypothetical protein